MFLGTADVLPVSQIQRGRLPAGCPRELCCPVLPVLPRQLQLAAGGEATAREAQAAADEHGYDREGRQSAL